ELQPERDLSRPPLFQVLFALDHDAGQPIGIPGLSLSASRIDTGTSKFDLSLHLTESAEGLKGYVEYSAELFEGETIARLAGHYLTLLAGAAADPDRSVSRLPLLTEAERRRVLVEFNATRADYGQEHLLHRLVQQQAR